MAYYGLLNYFKSKLLTRKNNYKKTKLHMYKTSIRQILSYASKTRAISNADKKTLILLLLMGIGPSVSGIVVQLTGVFFMF